MGPAPPSDFQGLAHHFLFSIFYTEILLNFDIIHIITLVEIISTFKLSCSSHLLQLQIVVPAPPSDFQGLAHHFLFSILHPEILLNFHITHIIKLVEFISPFKLSCSSHLLQLHIVLSQVHHGHYSTLDKFQHSMILFSFFPL